MGWSRTEDRMSAVEGSCREKKGYIAVAYVGSVDGTAEYAVKSKGSSLSSRRSGGLRFVSKCHDIYEVQRAWYSINVLI